MPSPKRSSRAIVGRTASGAASSPSMTTTRLFTAILHRDAFPGTSNQIMGWRRGQGSFYGSPQPRLQRSLQSCSSAEAGADAGLLEIGVDRQELPGFRDLDTVQIDAEERRQREA